MSKFCLALLFIIFLILPASTRRALAEYQDVLGVTTSTTPQIPATPDGPGFILPDSPIFFLDKLKQQIRLTFAITPEAKAKVYNSVAGERLAELRLMLDRKNQYGIAIDLREVSDNLARAVDQLHTVKLLGNDTKVLSRQLNTSINEKVNSLDILRSQAQGTLEAETKASLASLLTSKIQVENILPEGDLANEIKSDLYRKINTQVIDTSETVQQLSSEIAVLTEQASTAAQESRSRKEALIQQQISQKNTALHTEEQKLLLAELQKQDQMFQLQSATTDQAKKAAEDAKLAIQKYQEAEQALAYLKTHTVTLQTVTQQSPAPSGAGQSVAGTSTAVTPSATPQK